MAKANKSSRSAKGAKTAKHTKKNLGKRNNRTRRHRKGAKKGKNMKKGGFLFDTDYTNNLTDDEIERFVKNNNSLLNQIYKDKNIRNPDLLSNKQKFNKIIVAMEPTQNKIEINYYYGKDQASLLQLNEHCIAKKATGLKITKNGTMNETMKVKMFCPDEESN